MNIIIYILGAIGTILCVTCYHCSSRQNVLKMKFVADICWCVHYFLLGALSGCAVNAVCGVRELVYIYETNEKKKV